MTNIVRSTYRYKRPPKRKKAVPLEVPVVRAADPAKIRKRAKAAPSESTLATPAVISTGRKRTASSATPPASPAPEPAPNDDRKPSAIVTARKPGKRTVEVPEVSEEEHRRVGDLADAMMAEFKRVIAEKTKGQKP
jgi:hypothetical protein